MKIIIIGSIAAGVSAAARLAAAQRGAQITVYEKGGFYSCGTGGLPHYLCEDLDSLNKAIQAKETELNAQGITAHLRHEVRGIDAAARKVTVCDLATGRVFEDHYDKLVLATGSSNRVPQVPGSDRVGVQTLKTVEDLIFLKEFVRTPYVRDIVILGGSWAGLEIAKSFLKLGRNVRIIEKEQQLLPQFDPEVSKLIQKELEAQGVQFNLGEQVRSFPGRTFVEQVQTNRGTYPCDLCVVAIGVTPNTGLLAGTGAQLAPNGAVLIGVNQGKYCGQQPDGDFRTGYLCRGRLRSLPRRLSAHQQPEGGGSGDRPHRPDRDRGPQGRSAGQECNGHRHRPSGHLPEPPPHHHQAGV